MDGLGVGAVGGRGGDEELLLPSGERQGAPLHRPVGMDGGGEGGEEGGARVARADHGEVRFLRQVRETLGAPEAAECLLPPSGVGGAVGVAVAGVVGSVEVTPEAVDRPSTTSVSALTRRPQRAAAAPAQRGEELADDEAADGAAAAEGERWVATRHSVRAAASASFGARHSSRRQPATASASAAHGRRRRPIGGGGPAPRHRGARYRSRCIWWTDGDAWGWRSGATTHAAASAAASRRRRAAGRGREPVSFHSTTRGSRGRNSKPSCSTVGAAAGEALEPRRKVRELADRPRRAVGLEDARRVDRVLEAPRHRRPLAEAELLVHHAARPQQPAAARERVLGVGLADGVDLGVGGAPRRGGGGGGPEEERLELRQRPLRAERRRSSSSGWCATSTTSPPSPGGRRRVRLHSASAPRRRWRRTGASARRRGGGYVWPPGATEGPPSAWGSCRPPPAGRRARRPS